MQCPECHQISTFKHRFQVLQDLSMPLKIRGGKIIVDCAHTKKEAEPEPYEEDDEICTCEKCGADVRIADVQIVDAKTV